MATLKEAEAQYENRHDQKCECGAGLWRSIEWANQVNYKHKNTIPSTAWNNPNAGFIIIKRCKDCREKVSKAYHSNN